MEARELWDELEARLGESNGPLLFTIKKKICSLKQGNMNVMQYFLRLKQLWEVLAYPRPIPKCDCGLVLQKLTEFNRTGQGVTVFNGIE